MSNPFLNDAELFELTDKQRPSAQRRALDAAGIPYTPSCTKGRPLVERKHLYQNNETASTGEQPNFEGI